MKKNLIMLTVLITCSLLCGCATTPRVHQELTIETSMEDAKWIATGGDPHTVGKLPIKVCARISVDY